MFRCVPDDLVTSWAQYKAFANRQDKFGRTEEAKRTDESGTTKVTHDEHGSGGGVVGPAGADSNHPSTGHDHIGGRSGPTQAPDEIRSKTSSPDAHLGSREVLRTGEKKAKPDDEGLKPSGDDEAWHQWELDDMEQLLNEIRGHLVLYPTRFLEGEDLANNFLFNVSVLFTALLTFSKTVSCPWLSTTRRQSIPCIMQSFLELRHLSG